MKCTFSIWNKEKFLNAVATALEPMGKIDKDSSIYNSMIELYMFAEEWHYSPVTIAILKKDPKSKHFLIKKILSSDEMEEEYQKYLRHKILF